MNMTRILLFITLCVNLGQFAQAAQSDAERKRDFDDDIQRLDPEENLRPVVREAPSEEGNPPSQALRRDEGKRIAAQAVEAVTQANSAQKSLLQKFAHQTKRAYNWSKGKINQAYAWSQDKAQDQLAQLYDGLTVKNTGSFLWNHKSQIVRYGIPLYLAHKTGFLSGVFAGIRGKKPIATNSTSGESSLSAVGLLGYEVTSAFWKAYRALDPRFKGTATGALTFLSFFYLQGLWNNHYKKEIIKFYETNIRPVTTAASIVACYLIASKVIRLIWG